MNAYTYHDRGIAPRLKMEAHVDDRPTSGTGLCEARRLQEVRKLPAAEPLPSIASQALFISAFWKMSACLHKRARKEVPSELSVRWICGYGCEILGVIERLPLYPYSVSLFSKTLSSLEPPLNHQNPDSELP